MLQKNSTKVSKSRGGKIAVELIHVEKRFPGMTCPALDDVSIRIQEGEFVTVLGSSGCGKTTLIKMLNRLCEPDRGEILLFGEPVREQNPVILRRNIGYVIQQIGLFPHMTVKENISTIPKILKWDKKKTQQKVDEMLRLVALEPEEYRNRYPAQLSGGQQQRVGIARALIADPPLMLLDEPFGAIDAINREVLQTELKKIQEQSGRTYLFVTHDIREAWKLGTKVLVMNQGKILQFDSPEEIHAHPADEFVTELLRTADMGKGEEV